MHHSARFGMGRPHRSLWPCAQGIKVKRGPFPWTASGRAIANGRDEGITKLLFDDSPEAHGHGRPSTSIRRLASLLVWRLSHTLPESLPVRAFF